MNYPAHACPPNLDGSARTPEVVVCGIRGHAWCERCDPAPAALCPFCHGRGYSTAPVPPRQRKALT